MNYKKTFKNHENHFTKSVVRHIKIKNSRKGKMNEKTTDSLEKTLSYIYERLSETIHNNRLLTEGDAAWLRGEAKQAMKLVAREKREVCDPNVEQHANLARENERLRKELNDLITNKGALAKAKELLDENRELKDHVRKLEDQVRNLQKQLSPSPFSLPKQQEIHDDSPSKRRT